MELCRRAAAGDERLSVSRVDADVTGPSFTLDTLRRLHDQCPEDELTFIVGGDMAHSLPEWREPEAILALAELGVAARGDVSRDAILERISGITGVPERIRFFDMPRIDISSTRSGSGWPPACPCGTSCPTPSPSTSRLKGCTPHPRPRPTRPIVPEPGQLAG